MHFEHRYWSVNRLITGLPITNILELSSGFSFRGLALSHEQPVYYIDTDLPDLIATKQQFVDAFQSAPAAPTSAPTSQTSAAVSPTSAAANVPAEITGAPPAPDISAAAPESHRPNGASQRLPDNSPTAGPTPSENPAPHGHYELAPLNALDTAAFNAIVDRFPPGPLLILNEGLLVYLDDAEKAQLCSNILGALQHPGRPPTPRRLLDHCRHLHPKRSRPGAHRLQRRPGTISPTT